MFGRKARAARKANDAYIPFDYSVYNNNPNFDSVGDPVQNGHCAHLLSCKCKECKAVNADLRDEGCSIYWENFDY